MIKTKTTTLCLLILVVNSVWAEYISPVEYKSYTCEELQEEYLGWKEEDGKLDSKYYNSIVEDKNLPRKWQEEKDTAEARLKAIKKAAKKVSCIVDKKQSK